MDGVVYKTLRKFNVNQQQASEQWNVDRVLFFAVDEAHALVENANDRGVTISHLFRQGLALAHESVVRKYGEKAGIFGILADKNPEISAQYMSTSHSSRIRLFPAFVHAYTMDIHHETRRNLHMDKFKRIAARTASKRQQFYQDLVTEDNEDKVWQSLVEMGRPQWESLNVQKHKLLCGCDSTSMDSFQTSTMFGAASMLCRLGMRPLSSSPFSLHAVANFMAVLGYVSRNHDQYVSDYTSDPILTFGAARLWYYPHPDSLSLYILPQFRKMWAQDVIDKGEIGEVVARFVLLLAMDACGIATGAQIKECACLGEFYNVTTLLQMIHGQLRNQRGGITSADDAPKTMDATWKDWYVGFSHFVHVGFSHFVQLGHEPTISDLWVLLARRAAGIFPRNQTSAFLCIPIFRKSVDSLEIATEAAEMGASVGSSMDPQASMILVQVKTRIDGDTSYPFSSTSNLYPANLFSPNNIFHEMSPHKIIRIHMDMSRVNEPCRYYCVDCEIPDDPDQSTTEHKEGVEPKKRTWSYPLCIRGIDAWNGEGESSSVSVVTADVAKELLSLMSPLWNTIKIIDESLQCRQSVRVSGHGASNQLYVLPNEEVREMAEFAWSETMFDQLEMSGHKRERSKSAKGKKPKKLRE